MGPPKVITKRDEESGDRLEPMEEAVVEVRWVFSCFAARTGWSHAVSACLAGLLYLHTVPAAVFNWPAARPACIPKPTHARPHPVLSSNPATLPQVPEEHVGQVVDLMGQRKAQMVDMTAGGCRSQGSLRRGCVARWRVGPASRFPWADHVRPDGNRC